MDELELNMSQPSVAINSPDDLTFSVDLISAAVDELSFLADVDRHRPRLDIDGPALRRAVRRYEQCWMPLIASLLRDGSDIECRTSGVHSGSADVVGCPQQSMSSLNTDVSFAPPLDVHWIWHCHMLSPYSYMSDSVRLTTVDVPRNLDRGHNVHVTGLVVDHRVRGSDELRAARDRTRTLWNAAFPNEPFDTSELQQQPHPQGQASTARKQGGPVDQAAERATNGDKPDASEKYNGPEGYKSKCTYDLVAAVLRQSKFFYQVCTSFTYQYDYTEQFCYVLYFVSPMV
jgi:Glycine-rich domain-containing protein-like